MVKLCDFGFARAMSTDTIMLTSIKGTPLYMAPELVLQQPYNHLADLWSLGCILYEISVGVPPFYTDNIFQLVNLIVGDQVTWPATIDDQLKDFLQGLLRKKPDQRLGWPDVATHPFIIGDGDRSVHHEIADGGTSQSGLIRTPLHLDNPSRNASRLTPGQGARSTSKASGGQGARSTSTSKASGRTPTSARSSSQAGAATHAHRVHKFDQGQLSAAKPKAKAKPTTRASAKLYDERHATATAATAANANGTRATAASPPQPPAAVPNITVQSPTTPSTPGTPGAAFPPHSAAADYFRAMAAQVHDTTFQQVHDSDRSPGA